MRKHPGGVTTVINPTTLAHPALAFLRDYWNGKRGVRAMPSRIDIKPIELRDYLGWVMLVDVAADLNEFRYRLVGTLVTTYFMQDGTGKTVGELYPEDSIARGVRSLFRKCARDRVVVHAFGDARWLGPHFEDFEALYLPLSEGGEAVDMILHAFVFDRTSVVRSRQSARWGAS